MSYKTIKELKAGETIYQPFLVTKVERKSTKKDKWYTRLTVSDKSGDLEINCWAVPETPPELRAGTFCLLKVIIDTFKGQLSASSKEAPTLCNPPEDLSIYETRKGCPEDLIVKSFQTIKTAISQVRREELRSYLKRYFEHEPSVKLFCEAPASTTNRGAFRGGLANHTAKVLVNALNLYSNLEENTYPKCKPDLDIIICSALVHDIGKTVAYKLTEQGVAEYTTKGSLVDHLLISYEMSSHLFSQTKGVSNELENHINHCILSHHGPYSPAKPASVEAQVTYMSDHMDSSVSNFIEDTLKDKKTSVPNILEGTTYSSKKLYKL